MPSPGERDASAPVLLGVKPIRRRTLLESETLASSTRLEFYRAEIPGCLAKSPIRFTDQVQGVVHQA